MTRARKLLITMTATALAAGMSVAGAAPAALASNFSEPFATTWAYTDSHDPTATFVKQAGASPVGTRLDAGNAPHTSRFYFSFDLTKYRGDVIHQAYLFAQESTVTDCSAPAPAELWRTAPITAQTSWRHAPAELERIAALPLGAPSACPGYFSDEFAATINAALARHDTQVTFELRIAATQESDPRYGRTFNQPGMAVFGNYPPVISNPTSTNQGQSSCGTPAKPALASRFVRLSATVSDSDDLIVQSGTFAVWPVAHPDQRQEFFGQIYGTNFLAADPDVTGYPDGSILAWQARAYDGQDYSAWTTPCYLRLDLTPPAKAPVVTSKVYPSDQDRHGGPGVPGKFRFDPQGDRDVVAYSYYDNIHGAPQSVNAERPGEPATITYTPDTAGPISLFVTSIDAAGNRGPTAEHRFNVNFTAPNLTVDVGGVNLPSKLKFQSTVDGVTSFGYQVDGGAEVKVPATNQAGQASYTFTHVGYFNVTAKSYVKSKMVGSYTMPVYVTDAPLVSSNDFNFDHDAVVGQPGTFTFTPRTTHVVAYLFSDGTGNQQRVDAAADGTAVFSWTPQTAGYYDVFVQSVQADGSTSNGMDYQFIVIDPHPVVYSTILSSYPRTDGVGVPIDIQFSDALSTVTGYAYQVDGGPQQTVAADFGYAQITLTPDRAGDHTMTVTGQLSGGGTTPTTTWPFHISSGPLVTWLEFPSGTGGETGQPATFSFKPGLPNVVQYRYTFEGDQERTVAAGADGSATVSFTPGFAGYQTLNVSSVGADGTVSDTRTYQFVVRDPRVLVVGTYLYGGGYPAGGIGVPGGFGFFSQLYPDVVEFHYQLNGGPEQTVPASSLGTAYIALAPDRNGTNVLTVRSLTSSGELSPVSELDFQVGTAPLVTSAEYPDANWHGGVGVPGTFEFSGGTAGIVAFDYQFSDGTAGSVDANSAGVGSVVFTPTSATYMSVTVHGRLADGTATDSTSYYFGVNP